MTDNEDKQVIKKHNNVTSDSFTIRLGILVMRVNVKHSDLFMRV